jgi:hypothetical protein
MNLSDHFTFTELTRTDQWVYKEENRMYGDSIKGQLVRLAEFAEGIRDIIKVPMIVLSGVRSPALNKAVGGSASSQHIAGEALDFRPKGMEAEEAFRLILASGIPFGQLILEKRSGPLFIHASIGTKCQALYSPRAGVFKDYQAM